MATPSAEGAAESNSIESLLDPELGIPFDVHFDIEDGAGTKLGTLGGHKAILALKSSVFKAMLYGPMKETVPHIQIKMTSLPAFKALLQYIYGVDEVWSAWFVDVKELFLITDLAQRYDLPGLQQKVKKHAAGLLYPKDRVVEIAQVAEQFHVFAELSDILLMNCANFLLAILETPKHLKDFVSEWSSAGKSAEESSAALRLLARVDHDDLAFANTNPYVSDSVNSTLMSKVISHLRNIEVANKPRERLQRLKDLIDLCSEGEAKAEVLEAIDSLYPHPAPFLKSLTVCQSLDRERATLDGVPLTLETLVEDQFTHEASVRLHLDLMRLNTWADEIWSEEKTLHLWKELLRSIPAVKSIMLFWLTENTEMFDREAKWFLEKELESQRFSESSTMAGLEGFMDAYMAYNEFY